MYNDFAFSRRTLSRRFVFVAAAALATTVGGFAIEPTDPASPRPEPRPGMSTTDFAKSDPLKFTMWARDQFEENVGDYKCTMIKQERVGGKLSEVQTIEMRYRKNPNAVFMIWKKNEDSCRRALYQPNHPDYTDKKGRRLVRVEPAGAIARMFVKDIMIDIDSDRAKKASRRSIADAGFGATFRLLEQYNTNAKNRGDLNFKYVGKDEIDGRVTLCFERLIPEHKVDGETYVDARMELHIDEERLIPVAVYSYADQAGRKLLGKYIFVDVDLKPKFTSRDFVF